MSGISEASVLYVFYNRLTMDELTEVLRFKPRIDTTGTLFLSTSIDVGGVSK